MSMNLRIKQRRKELGLTQQQVAKPVGVSRVAISHWESDETAFSPKSRYLEKLAEILKCSAEWILTGKETLAVNEAPTTYYLPRSEAEYAGDFDTWDNHTPLSEDEVEIPFYKEVELAAGNGMIVQREDSGRKLRFAKSTLRRAGVDPAAAACVRVTGDSMKPVIPDGATVGIDTSNTRIKDGEMYAIDHDGQLRVKVIHRIGGSGIRLRSFNMTDYPDEDYQSEQTKSIKIIGRVFWYSVLR